jgi:hypothetical protein
MKFRVTMKDPDGCFDAFTEAADKSLGQVEGLTDKEREVLVEHRLEDIKALAGLWFEYDEYLTVEIDTEARTCTVVARNG